MTNVVPLFKDQPLQIPVKLGRTLLEALQERRGMPYHPPTVQVIGLTRGEFRPHNPLAKQFALLARSEVLTARELGIIEDMGMVVERVGG